MSQATAARRFRTSNMGFMALLVLLGISVCTVSQAETNTPFAAGTRVSVTSTAGTVTGVLKDVTAADWIGIIEDGSTEPTYVRGRDLIVRRADQGDVPAPQPAPLAPMALTDELEVVGGHYIYGRPRIAIDHYSFTPDGFTEPVDGITYHVREAFTFMCRA